MQFTKGAPAHAYGAAAGRRVAQFTKGAPAQLGSRLRSLYPLTGEDMKQLLPVYKPEPWESRKRMNWHGICASYFIPALMFCILFAVMSFEVHYRRPLLSYVVVLQGLLVVLAFGALAWRRREQEGAGGLEPSWFMFLFVMTFIAWGLAVLLGDVNFVSSSSRYFDAQNLRVYTDVNPSEMHGDQLMDAGSAIFAKGTNVDVNLSYAFKNEDVYCVAPISIGDKKLATYDFWAVGVNCCSGNQKDFHCGDLGTPHTAAGFRLMQDDQRAFFRLAVQQAEAAYELRADHPLFFHWVQDPIKTTNGYRTAAWMFYLKGCCCFCVFHVFVTAMAVLAFGKSDAFAA